MYLISLFQEINQFMEKLIDLNERKTESIEEKNEKRFDEVQKEEALTSYDLKQKVDAFTMELKKISVEKKVEPLLHSVMTVVSEKEKDELMACRRCAIRFEQKLKNVTKRNERLVAGIVSTEKIILDARQHVLRERGNDVRLFNKKY
jgi:hypothetical protein